MEESNITTESSISSSSEIKNSMVQTTFYGFLGATAFTLTINARILYVAKGCSGIRRQRRNVSILIFHLFALNFLSTFAGGFYFAEKFKVMKIEDNVSCGLMAFAKNVVQALIPLNVYGILYEQTQALHPSSRRRLLSSNKLYLMWIAAIGANWPALGAYEFETNESQAELRKCINVLPKKIQVVYQLGRFFAFHFVPCGHMLTIVWRLCSDLKYLKELSVTPRDSISRKINRIKFSIGYSLIFVADWTPYGFLLIVLNELAQPMPFWFIPAMRIFGLVNFVVVTFNPMIHLCMNAKCSVREVIQCCGAFDGNGQELNENELVMTDMSRRVTVRRSEEINISDAEGEIVI